MEIYKAESGRKINQEAYDLIMKGLTAIIPKKNPPAQIHISKEQNVSMHPIFQIQVFGNPNYALTVEQR